MIKRSYIFLILLFVSLYSAELLACAIFHTNHKNGVYMPYEGVNNKRLFVDISAAPITNTPFIMLKPIRESLEMICVILE